MKRYTYINIPFDCLIIIIIILLDFVCCQKGSFFVSSVHRTFEK